MLSISNAGKMFATAYIARIVRYCHKEDQLREAGQAGSPLPAHPPPGR
jgi:hypothetical protein